MTAAQLATAQQAIRNLQDLVALLASGALPETSVRIREAIEDLEPILRLTSVVRQRSLQAGERRFEATPSLFGGGVGGATYGDVSCDWCRRDYTGREKPLSNEAIGTDYFGDLQVCDCCYGLVEAAVLAAMPDILPWYGRIVASRRARLEEQERLLRVATGTEPEKPARRGVRP